MLSHTEKQLIRKLQSNKYPDVASDGMGFFIIWADGRAIVGYKNKKDAIAFIQQGDMDVMSVTYRERNSEKNETVRNKFTPDKSAFIHSLLYKEAAQKREHQKNTVIHNLLFAEDADRLDKVGMARQSGGSTLRNSGWNTDWHFKDPTADIDRVKDQISKKSANFFTSLSSGNISETSDIRPDSLSFVFSYIRTILPDNNEEASMKARNALTILDELLPGFRTFQQDIEARNIPLNPYFMPDNFSKQNGRVSSSGLKEFIAAEKTKQLQLPDGQPIPNQSHYNEHLSRHHLDVSFRGKVARTFSMADIDKVPNATWMKQAIEDKAANGYQLSTQNLLNTMIQLRDQKYAENNIDPESTDKAVQAHALAYQNHYVQVYRDILEWWKDRSKDLRMFSLKLVLKHLVYVGGGTPDVGPNEFRIKNATSLYQSNGWDSSLNAPNETMPTIPPLRQLPGTRQPDGSMKEEIVYDRGNGNMGYDHLVLNWKGGLDQILTKWGAKADEWMKILQSGKGIETLMRNAPEAYAAYQNVLSLQTGNRTGAENLLDLLNKYPKWGQFNSNHLQKSLASEIRTVNEYLKTPIKPTSFTAGDLSAQISGYVDQMLQTARENPELASQYLQNLSAQLCQIYRNGQMAWDTLTLALNALNRASRTNKLIKSNGISKLRGSEYRSMLPPEGFDLLKQYGYQVGKMMDFLYAVMSRCCHEQVNTRADGRQENFFGHQYSTSSGKSKGGEILLNVEYKNLTAQPSGDGVEVNEKLGFTLAQRTGANEDPIVMRLDLPWQQMVDTFNEAYPEAGYQLDQINEPVNTNLDVLELAVKDALNSTRGNIKVTYRNSEGEIDILSGEELAAEQMDVLENAGETDLITEEAPVLEPQILEPEMIEPPYEPSLEDEEWSKEWQPETSPEEVRDQLFQTEENTPDIFQEKKTMQKEMPEESIDYLQKQKNNKRRLLRKSPQVPMSPIMGTIEEKLQKVANRLDQRGEKSIADKLDLLLKKIIRG